MSIPRPKLALTLGDPAGIGPEIVLKALADPEVQSCAHITVVGDRQVLEATYRLLRDRSPAPLAHPAGIPMLECNTGFWLQPGRVGQGDADSGGVSFVYLKTAVEQTLRGRVSGDRDSAHRQISLASSWLPVPWPNGSFGPTEWV